MEFLSLTLNDIIKSSFEVDGFDFRMQKEVIQFAMDILISLDKEYKVCMHLIETISQYFRMSHFGADRSGEFNDLKTRLVQLCIQKTIYPEFFDIETLAPSKREYRQKFRFGNKSKKESDDEDEMDVADMSTEQSAFIHMRDEMKYLILEISLKAKKLESVFTQIAGIATSIVENAANLEEGQLDFQIEAVLMVFYHFLQGGLKNLNENMAKSTVDILVNFFLEDQMKEFFAGKKSHCLVAK